MRSLVSKPIAYATCFISYSRKKEVFAQRLSADLQGESIPCWLAPEPTELGDTIRHRIDEPIRFYDKLLLVLSEHSIASTWVQDEVEAALEKERRRGRHVLFPIALDTQLNALLAPGRQLFGARGISVILPGGNSTTTINKHSNDCCEI
jgi:hypothetical protein